MSKHKFPYRWTLKDANFTGDKGKVFSCFACGGGSSMGYKLAGFDVIGCNEIDPRVNAVYVHNLHPKFNFCEPIQTFRKRKDLPKELYDLDILDGSYPCFSGDSLVLTSNGYKPIKDVKVGDYVLTHKGRFRKVLDTMHKFAPETILLKMYGAFDIRCTANHPFLTKRLTRSGKHNSRQASTPQWVSAGALSVLRTKSGKVKAQDYLGISINKQSGIPDWAGYETHDIDLSSADFWYFIGRWLGDGWQRKGTDKKGRTYAFTMICCRKHQKDDLERIVKASGFNYSIAEQRTSFRFVISSRELYNFIESHFGHGAEHKHIPESIINLPIPLLKALLEGYLSAGGSKVNESTYRVSSVSKNLILALARIVPKVYGTALNSILTKDACDSYIEGRKVRCKESYSAVIKTTITRQAHSYLDDDYIWLPYKSSETLSGCEVYNLCVEEDESYTINNIAVHNCSTFSLAGDREKAWGTKKKFREGQVEQELDKLAFEFIALAKELQPKVMVSENVVGLIQGDAKAYARKILDEMYRAGYIPQIFTINSKDCGVPQSRPRVFIIGLRDDLATPFLEQISLFETRPRLNLDFNEDEILFEEVCDYKGWLLPDGVKCYWDARLEGERCVADTARRIANKNTMFNLLYVKARQVCPTLPARMSCLIHWEKPCYLSDDEVRLVSSFPMDYDFLKQKPHYICGMCVPPVVMANVATRIYDTWLQYI